MKRCLLAAVFAFFANAGGIYAQPDSCLKLLGPEHSDTTWSNPDSVKVDSCISSSTYGQLYAKGWFQMRFTYYVLPTPIGPEDTLIYRVWQDIDTQYASVRSAFDTLDQKYGSFIFRKIQPHIGDTASGGDKLFNMWFDDYVNIDSMILAIESIPFVDYCKYVMRAGQAVASVSAKSNSSVVSIEAFPNPHSGPTELKISVGKSCVLRLEVLDVLGNVVRSADLGYRNQGVHSYHLNSSGWSAGIYYVRLVSQDGKVQTVMLVKE